jgi:uncharacterized protein (PEP-CTERM system associated)
MSAMSRPQRAGVSVPLFRLTCIALGCAVGASGMALAQDAAPPASSRVVTTLSVSETYVRGSGNLSSGATDGEFITRVSPGLSWTSRSGRLQGSVNYIVDVSQYSKRAESSRINNTLFANLKTTVVEQRAFVDVQANVGQTSISPFGRQSGGDTFQNNPNRAEFSTVQVSPYVVGNVAGVADYTVRLSGAANGARGYSASNTTSWSALATLRSSSPGRLGWGLSAQRSDTQYQLTRSISTERITAELNARPLSDLLLFATGGQERTNALDLNGRTYTTYGGGLRWVPSVRTNVSLSGEKRYFGNSFNGLFEHRTPQTVWRFSATQNSTDYAGQTALTSGFTLFQLYFQQFASTVPDPIAREQAVRDFLRLLGRNPNEVVGGGTLVSALSLQRRQELSAAWVGRRTTVNLQAYTLNVRPLDPSAAVAAVSSLQRVRQSGATASVSYRLTPQTAITAVGSRQVTNSNGLLSGNSLNSLSVGVTTQFTSQTSFGLNVRYADFSGSIDPYREALATATLNFRF